MVNQKRLLLYGLIAICAIGLGVWLYNYLFFGTVEVTSKNGEIVLSYPTANGVSGATIHQGAPEVKARLKSGNYIVSAASGQAAVSQTIHVKAHTFVKYDITPLVPGFLEPVLAESSQNIAAGSRLVYLSSAESKLYQVDSANNLSAIAPNNTFRVVHWADPSYGVAQDNNGNLYAIDGTTVRSLSLPNDIKEKQYLQYSVTHNHSVYVADGSDLYLGSETGGFKKIQSNLTPASLIVAGDSIVAWVNDNDTNQQESPPSITVIGKGKEVTRDGIGSFVGAWSSDDKYLAVSSQNGGEILDNQLKHVATIPQSSLKNPVWLSAAKLAYSTAGQLWVYDLTLQRAEVIGQANAGETIEEIAPSQDGSYLYVKVKGVNDTSSIRRLSLKNTPLSPLLTKLTVFLPLNLSECAAGYLNFTKLSVLVRPYNPSLTSQCLQDVRSNLADDQVDVSSLSFMVGPVLSLD
jgi:hypothetical protein